MIIPDSLIVPIFMPKAIEDMGLDITQRHITVIALIAKGYITTKMVLSMTLLLKTPPRNYADLLCVIKDLESHQLIYFTEGVNKRYRGRSLGALSLSMQGYVFLNQLAANIKKLSDKKVALNHKPANWPY